MYIECRVIEYIIRKFEDDPAYSYGYMSGFYKNVLILCNRLPKMLSRCFSIGYFQSPPQRLHQ